MDLQESRNVFSTILKIAVGLLVLVVVAFFAYSYLTRDNPIYGKMPNQYFQNQLPETVTWDFTNLKINKPTNGPVYKIKNRKVDRKQAAELAVKTGLPSGGLITRDKNRNEFFSVRNQSGELSVGLSSGEIHYKKNLEEFPESVVEEEKALAAAKKEVKRLGIEVSLYDLNRPRFNYFKATKNIVELHSARKEDANLVYVSFPMKIDDYEVFTVGGQQFLTLGLNSKYEIFSFDFAKIEITPYEGATYQLLGDPAAALTSGKGKLDHFIPGDKSLAKASYIYVDQGRMVLYNDNRTNYLQPILVFNAVASDGQNQLKAQVYLPALKN
jgi:hypothetical protein